MLKTRITKSKRLNNGKMAKLVEISKGLGVVRANVWKEFGGIKGAAVNPYTARNGWIKHGVPMPARLWKATMADALGGIKAYREAVKVEVKEAIKNRPIAEQKKLFALLGANKWTEDNFLHRQMRNKFTKGVSKTTNQIILDEGCYRWFLRNNRGWIAIQGLEKGKRIHIPLTSNRQITGNIRLVLGKNVIIHHQVEIEQKKDCGDRIVGIDKGYTEVFADSDGDFYGMGFGRLQSEYSDDIKTKYQRRNKLFALSQKNKNIAIHNLGTKKMEKKARRNRNKIKDMIYKAANAIVDKASVVVCEDLTAPMAVKPMGADVKRRLSSWTKGVMASALADVATRRGSAVALGSCAYTSQMDSANGCLLGKRVGDKFYHYNGGVSHADTNAAKNILGRYSDVEISMYTPYQDIKKILLRRTELFKAECFGLQSVGSML